MTNSATAAVKTAIRRCHRRHHHHHHVKNTITMTTTKATMEMMLPLRKELSLTSSSLSILSSSSFSTSSTTTTTNNDDPATTKTQDTITTTTQAVRNDTGDVSSKEGFSSSSSSSKYSEILQRLDQFWMERTGTTEIAQLKQDVSTASFEFDSATRNVAIARRKVDETLLEYESINSKHNSLLHKRDKWTPDDASSFATLVNKEVTTRQKLEEARSYLQKHEEKLSKSQLSYMNAMRRRYHEEQIWQDKWRVFGTYGTWTLIILNSVVFLASQYVHRLREVGRIKAIEELINEKIPTSLIPSNTMETTSDVSVEITAEDIPFAHQKQQQQQQQRVVGEQKEGQHVVESQDNTTSDNNSKLQRPLQTKDDDSTLQQSKGEAGRPKQQSTTPTNALFRSAAMVWLHSHRVWNQTQDAMASVHLPSAAIGAAVTSAAFGIAILVVGLSGGSSSSTGSR